MGFSPDVRGSRCGGDGHHGKARGVAGGERDHGRDRERTGQGRSLGAEMRSTCPRRRCRLRCHFRRAGAPLKGGTTSWKNWCESIAKNASETFRGGRGAGAGASADDGAAAAAAAASGGSGGLVVALVVKVKDAVTWKVMSGVGG